MRGVRFTKAEVAFLRERLPLAGAVDQRGLDCQASILAKLKAAEEAPKGVNPWPIEAALVTAAMGKVVQVSISPAIYGRLSRQVEAVGATEDDARAIGAWMARQGWLKGPQTLLDVLNKWPQWVAKARATSPPPSAPRGFGDGAGRQDAAQGQGEEERVQPAVASEAPRGVQGPKPKVPGFR